MKTEQNTENQLVSFIGRTYKVDFGESVFHTTFDTDHQLTFRPIKGSLGVVETVNYTQVKIHPGAYLLFWQEQDKTTVTGYWDFIKRVVYSNVTLPGNAFLNLCGSLTLLT